jgi:hypothetical protein
MPRFAANLGNSPLEPMKAAEAGQAANSLVPEVLQLTFYVAGVNQKVFQQENVPAAQFDWGGSGLVNPLDCKYWALSNLSRLFSCILL